MAPMKPGKNYYEQKSPSKRGFKFRGFNIHESELESFEEGMHKAGFAYAGSYLRSLVNADRVARGLPPLARQDGDDQ